MNDEKLNFKHEVPFTMIDRALLLSEDLNVYQKVIYCILCAYASNADKRCYPSYSTIAEKAGCSRKKAIDTIAELIKLNLITKQKQFNGKGENTSNIYNIRTQPQKGDVRDISPDKSDTLPDVHRTPPSIPDTPKLYPKNYNQINYMYENYQSISKTDRDRTGEQIKENIEYDILVERGANQNQLDEIVTIILDTICSTSTTVRVGSNDTPREIVKSRLLKLNDQHLQYVLEVLAKNTTKIKNIRAYMLTVLYNAPTTIDNYYQAEVNHDLHGGMG